MSTAAAAPRFSKPNLVLSPGLFAVQDGPIYNYYAITLGKKEGNFVPIVKSPLILNEGYITFENKLYFVSSKDLARRKINVTASIAITTTPDGNSDSPANGSTPSTELVETYPNTDQPGTGQVLEFQVDQDANVAWQEQIGTLLYLEDSEAEWEFLEDTPQSQPADEISAVPVAN